MAKPITTQGWYPEPPFWTLLPKHLAESAREDWEERAAIMQYCGGQSQGGAEMFAYAYKCVEYGIGNDLERQEDRVRRIEHHRQWEHSLWLQKQEKLRTASSS